MLSTSDNMTLVTIVLLFGIFLHTGHSFDARHPEMAYSSRAIPTTIAILSSSDNLRENTETLEVKTNIDTEPTLGKHATKIEKTGEEKEAELEPAPMNKK